MNLRPQWLSNSEAVLGLIMILSGIIVVISSSTLARQVATMPAVVGWLMAACGVLNLWAVLNRGKTGKGGISFPQVVLLFALLVFVASLRFVPIFLSIGIYTFGIYLYILNLIGRRNDWRAMSQSLLMSAIVVGSTYLMFILLLGMRMPRVRW